MLGNIYVYRSGGMGDVLWLEPVLKSLSSKYKNVYFYTNFKSLFENIPYKNVIIKDIPPGWFRAILKLLNFVSGKKKYHRLDGYCYEAMPKMPILHAYQKYFGLEKTEEYPTIYLSEKESSTKVSNKIKYAVLHLDANSSSNFRKVYGINWEIIVRSLAQKNIDIIQIGNRIEPIEGTTIFSGNLRELIQLINHSSLFIGVDSGPSHIAASLNIPSIIFFGSVNPWFRHFKSKFKGVILQQYCEYAGCYHEVIGGSGQECKLVGKNGVPKCCVHSDQILLNALDTII